MKHSDVFKLAIGPLEKLVLLALLDYGNRAFPRQETLATKASISRSAVQRAVRNLREAGYVTTTSRGKALCYRLCCVPQTQHDASNRRRRCVPQTQEMRPIDAGILTNPFNESIQPGAADAARVVESPWDGIDPEDERRIRRWCGRHDAEVLCQKQRGVTLRRLGELCVRVSDHARWWTRLGAIWAETGVPPYQTLKAELDAIGPDARDRLAVLAFRIGVGRVAA
jgi:biotin operon repressor